MKTFLRVLKSYTSTWQYFHIKLSYRIYLALGFSLVVGLMDGFGLAMFLPILEMLDGNKEVNPETMGNLDFLLIGIKKLQFDLDLKTILLVMLVFFALKGLAKFGEVFYRNIVQQYFIKKLRIENIALLSNYSFKAFLNADTGRIQNTLGGEMERVAGAYRFYFLSMQTAIMLVVYIYLAFLANPKFAISVFIGGVLSNFLFQIIYKKTKKLSKSITNGNHYYQGLLMQKISFFKYLKATGVNTLFSKKIKIAISAIERDNLYIGYYNAVLQSIREPITVFVVVVVVLVQVNYFEQTIGLIVLSLLFFYRSLTFLMSFQTSWNSFLNMSGSLHNMSDFQESLKINQNVYGQKTYLTFNDKIEFLNVSFSFGKVNVLNKINLKIFKNRTYAFVGQSGSGKTTLINLISGLLDPISGQILLDGICYSEINIESFQRRIGYITQESVIFNDTIFNNVTLWSEPTIHNLNRFWKVLSDAAIIDFVLNLEGKEDTLLGNNGINISGGQKQRISIARELYKEIDLLILDEATSSLDVETEMIIQNNIEKLKGKVTLLIIAHRLTTIKSADHVILLEDGEVQKIGSFENVIREHSMYL